ncbi:MAG TPA: hypothetical protein VMV52_01475 [Candidatus Nanopelagicaceae bacterium]|nr:hypothetical protein [Candidatus Nanopelagicaceae bacterium]
MKNPKKAKRISALTAVGALALVSLAFGSSALAADTTSPTPTPIPSPRPTISAMSGNNPLDAEVDNESEAEAILGSNPSSLGVLSSEVETAEAAEVPETPETSETAETPDSTSTSEAPGTDNEVDAVEAEDQQEQASFDEDINAANQAGESEDAVQLQEDAAVVASVTAPVVEAMVTDNAQANAIITGVPTK